MSLWGGRFESGPGETLWAYTTDVSDRRLLADDIAGSRGPRPDARGDRDPG